jgi:hypothetical protein
MKKLSWPIPALLTWLGSWLLFQLLLSFGLNEMLAILVPTFLGGLLSRFGDTPMRKALVMIGFPVSWLVLNNQISIAPEAWLILMLIVILIYPKRAWKDAPLFPTPRRALRLVPDHITLLADAKVLDAGSGMGDGLIALRDAFPRAQLHGLEMSWPLRWLSALRCPFARIRQGDIWQANWQSYELVYMFQRPETMPRAVEKAQAELNPGAWLVSLEFEARQIEPFAVVESPDGRPVWIYQMPFHHRETGFAINVGLG